MSQKGIKLQRHIQLVYYLNHEDINNQKLTLLLQPWRMQRQTDCNWLEGCLCFVGARMMNISNRVCVRQCQLLQQALDIKSEGHLQNEEIRDMTERWHKDGGSQGVMYLAPAQNTSHIDCISCCHLVIGKHYALWRDADWEYWAVLWDLY